MSSPRTVLEQLLDGRSALVREVERLSAMVADLDAVIGGIGGMQILSSAPSHLSAVPSADASPTAPASTAPESTTPGTAAADGTVAAADAPPRAWSPAEEPTGSTRPPATPGDPAASVEPSRQPKSIRVHVLEMLAAEDRSFALSEIIDRIHGAGIRAHDDAVRSITIKLMKDGQVDRVGRGQYRLARHDEADDHVPVSETATTPAPVGRPPLDLSQPWAGVGDSTGDDT